MDFKNAVQAMFGGSPLEPLEIRKSEVLFGHNDLVFCLDGRRDKSTSGIKSYLREVAKDCKDLTLHLCNMSLMHNNAEFKRGFVQATCFLSCCVASALLF